MGFLVNCAGGSRSLKASKNMMNSGMDHQSYFQPSLKDRQMRRKEQTTGSLWNDGYVARLYDNMYRASRIGDTVMIVVDEKASAKGTGDTKADRKTEESAQIDALGGLMTKLQTLLSGLNPANLISAERESKFQGKASTARTGELFARITATVTEVLRNGNMVIRGEQRIKMNQEEQILIVEGIIRPYDIRPDNTVPSSAIANARISFSGFGVMAEKQKPGWLTRLLDYIWPF